MESSIHKVLQTIFGAREQQQVECLGEVSGSGEAQFADGGAVGLGGCGHEMTDEVVSHKVCGDFLLNLRSGEG